MIKNMQLTILINTECDTAEGIRDFLLDIMDVACDRHFMPITSASIDGQGVFSIGQRFPKDSDIEKILQSEDK